MLADLYENTPLNSPNDVVITRDGTIYFTDPTYGHAEYVGVPRTQELKFQGLFRLCTDETLELLADDFDQPNGLCLSLDERTLYVNDTTLMHIRRFDILVSGQVVGGDVFTKVGGGGDGVPDGMKIDSLGRVYCTGPGGIHVYDERATEIGIIDVPEVVGNFNWGLADRSRLFICAGTSLYSVPTLIPGVLSR